MLEKGHYERKKIAVGGKPIWLMKKLVEDYTKPGDVVCDPFAGGATTLAAATMLGRKSVGRELREEIYQKALERLSGITTESDAA